MTLWLFLAAAGVAPLPAALLGLAVGGFHLHANLLPVAPSIEAAVLAAATAA